MTAASIGRTVAALIAALAVSLSVAVARPGPGSAGTVDPQTAVIAAAPAPGAHDHGSGPGDDGDDDHSDDHGDDEGDDHGDGHAAAAGPVGLAVSEAGYTLMPETKIVPAGVATKLRFHIHGPAGPVRDYTVLHEKQLHLIVVRRDLVNYQHLHPTLGPDGTWTISLKLPDAGTYRMFADFAPVGLQGRDSLVLGADLFVSGAGDAAPLPSPSKRDKVGDLVVAMQADPRPGVVGKFRFTVSKDGKGVTDLEPYLGSFGHLVALREGDLAYQHMHPSASAAPGSRGGPVLEFTDALPTAGRYVLFLDFARGGKTMDASFVVDVKHDAEAVKGPAEGPPVGGEHVHGAG